MLQCFGEHFISQLPTPGKMEELDGYLQELRERRSQQSTLGEMMVLGGRLIFQLMGCFDKMARGGLQPFFHWLSEHFAYSSQQNTTSTASAVGHSVKGRPGDSQQQQSLISKHRITASLAMTNLSTHTITTISLHSLY